MLKIGLIGAGKAGKAHAASYKHIENIKIVAVADTDLERAKCLAKEFGADALDHGDKIFDRDDIDMVDICLPTYLNHEYVLKAAEAKKDILCQMPMALSIDNAKEMIEAANSAGVKFMVAHELRFSPKYLSAKKATEDGSIGTARTLRAYRGGVHPGRNTPWKSDIEKSGGAILDMAIQDIDFLRWCFGPIKEVYGKGNLYDRVEYLEYDMLTLDFDMGLIAHIAADWSKPEGALPYASLDISGEVGTIRFETKDEVTLDAIYESKTGNTIEPESPLDILSNPNTKMIMAFIEAIEKDLDVPVDPKESLESLNIALSAMESIRQNRPVLIKEAF